MDHISLVKRKLFKPNIKLKSLSKVSEKKKIICLPTVSSDLELLHRYSSFNKLKRIIAYCIRFNLRKQYQGSWMVEKLVHAERISIIKLFQTVEFAEIISSFKQEKQINKKSKLLTLDPFFDNHGILRVGGRIKKLQSVIVTETSNSSSLIALCNKSNSWQLSSTKLPFWYPDHPLCIAT